jgi:hypothetical protein
MKNQKSIMIAAAAVSVFGVSQARAQSFSYSADDLVLNFRNTASITANDLEINLGPISSFTSFSGTETVVPASVITSTYGSPSAALPIGMSGDAADASGTTGTLWVTRADSTPGVAPTVVPGSTSGNSYQAQGELSSFVGGAGQGTINFGGDLNIAASKGGNIESIQTGSAPVYEALWQMPVSGTADTYLGYFTFNQGGSVQFTSVSSVPEPSTYALFGVSGLLAVVFRRQLRSLVA